MMWDRSWRGLEQRSGSGDYTDSVLALVEQQARGGSGAGDVLSTSAVEVAAGAWQRALQGCTVRAPEWAARAITPRYLGMVGRSLIVDGEHLSVIDMTDGQLTLIPSASWHYEGGERPGTWYCRATTYGPSTSVTRVIPAAGVVHHVWGSRPSIPYVGRGPLAGAHRSTRLQAETERSLADEHGGPIANLLVTPEGERLAADPDDPDDDPIARVRTAVNDARGRAVLLETTAGGGAAGPTAAPRRDWDPRRIGPAPTEASVIAQKQLWGQLLAAAGVPAAVFDADAAGTARKESYRLFFELGVEPVAKAIEAELTEKLEVRVRLDFGPLAAKDIAIRAKVFRDLARAGRTTDEAAALSGMLLPDEESA